MSTSNLPANMSTMLAGLQAAKTSIAVSAGSGDPFLKLAKSGVFQYGADGVEVDKGSAWAADPASFQHGFICWNDDPDIKVAEKLGERMVPATDPAVQIADLEKFSAPWVPQLGVAFLCLNGQDKGTRVVYTTTSKGGIKGLSALLGEVIAKLQAGEADVIVPVVEFETTNYKHPKYGTIYNPIFRVTRWESLGSGTPAQAAAAIAEDPPEVADPPAVEPEPAPATRRRRRVAA